MGFSSTLIDIGVLYLLVEKAHMAVIPAAVISFICAVCNGFFWNKHWTFGNTSPRLVRQYIKFTLVALFGLALNTTILYVAVEMFGVWYIAAKLCASGILFLWNFCINTFWTFRDYAIPRPAVSQVFAYDLSVIIPAYNEESVIEKTLESIRSYGEAGAISAEIIVVDDGSTDGTHAIAQSFALRFPMCVIVKHDRNGGKGASVRDGLLAARGKHVLFMDADSATPIAAFDTFLPWFEKGFDIVIGSRYLPTSAILSAQPFHRVALGRIGNILIRLLLIDGIADTQCGFKAFTFEAVHAIAPCLTITAWGFDMEILSVGQQMGFRIAEVPVEWSNSERKSRLRPLRDAHRTLSDLLTVKYNLLTNKYHDSAGKK